MNLSSRARQHQLKCKESRFFKFRVERGSYEAKPI
jgi:hypothetical protein